VVPVVAERELASVGSIAARIRLSGLPFQHAPRFTVFRREELLHMTTNKSLATATLGRTGLKVTRLGFGAMEVRDRYTWNGRPVTEKQVETLLNTVLDAGINFIDTSQDYGRSEEFIGSFLAKRRSEFFIATKCGCSLRKKEDGTYETPHVWTRENCVRGLHQSLERLKTDVIDLMQLHNPSVEECENGKLVEALQEMKKSGKIRHIGISTTLPHLPTYLKWGVFDTFQIPYSGLQREHENSISDSAGAGIGTIIRGGVAKGEHGIGPNASEEKWKKFEAARLDELRDKTESRTGFLLRFALSHPQAHTIIVGTLKPEHLRENVQAAQRGPLPADVYTEAKRRLDSVGITPASS
jgi:aryl-alcohol dehydrogenase-like predicted oxidoreductase